MRSLRNIMVCLSAMLTLGAGEAWGYNIWDAHVYFDNTNTNWDTPPTKSIFFIPQKNDNNTKGSAALNMSVVKNTKLLYWNGSWGDSKVDDYSRFAYCAYASGGYGYENNESWSRVNKNTNCYGITGTLGSSTPNGQNDSWLYVAASGTYTNTTAIDLASTSHLTNGYSDLNHNQTVHVMLSEDDGTSYSEITTSGTWRGDISATRTYMSGHGASTTVTENLSSSAYVKTAAITSTFTLTESNTAAGYAFKGWALDNEGPDETGSTFSIENVRGANDIYVYFAVSPSVSISSVTATTDATPLLGESVTIAASTQNVSGTPTINYQVRKPGGEWTTVGSTTATSYPWTPAANDPIGEYEFRTKMTYNAVEYTSGSTITKYIGKMWTLKIKEPGNWIANIYLWKNDGTENPAIKNDAWPGVAISTYRVGSKTGQWNTLSIYSLYDRFVVSNSDASDKSSNVTISSDMCVSIGNATNHVWSTNTSASCPGAPIVTTNAVSTKNLTSATLGGNITNDGSDIISEYGYYYSTNASLSSSNLTGTKVQVGTDDKDGSYSQSQTGLSIGTTYYVMAYAVNPHGIGYGDVVSFSTDAATLELEGTPDYATNTVNISANTNMIPANGFSSSAYLCCNCTSKPDGASFPTYEYNNSSKTITANGVTSAGSYTFRVALRDADACSGSEYVTNTVTITMKAIPDYSSKIITHTINSAAGDGYIIGAGTVSDHYELYQTQAAEHGRIDLRMDYSGVDDAKDAIYYSVGGSETGVMTDAASVASATMSLNTSTGTYSPAIKVYAKVDGQKKDAYAASLANLYYDIVATPTLELALKTTADAAIDANAGLEVGTSFKLAPTLTGAIRNGAYITYSYKISGSSDEWTEIATRQATNTACTWSENLPTEPNIYTIKATYTDLGVTVEATQDIVYWKDYTIYVWDPDDYAKYVHIWNASQSVHPWGNAEEAMTDLSGDWGTGWRSFSLRYPLYKQFKVHLNNSSAEKAAQSVEYTFTQEPSAENLNLYFRCTYQSGSNWGLAAGIEAPQQPEITITAVNVYATKIVVDVAIDNHYSLLTAHNITINGATPGGSRTGEVTNKGGGTYRYTLTGLTENTEYTFRATATNALGTSTKAETVTTNAQMPITFTIKVSNNLMANSSGYWGANGKTSVKVKYWNNEAGWNGSQTLELIKKDDSWHWYKCTFPDSPVSFYVMNANNDPESVGGGDRSSDWRDAAANGCAQVVDGTHGQTGNHNIEQVDMCGTHFKLEYFNGKTTTVSNVIGDASEKMSLFIGAYNGGLPAGRSLKLYKFTTGWDSGNEISLSTLNLADSAVYVVSLKEGVAFDDADADATKWDFVKYTGNYYIRTYKADGGWNNYKGASNQMTYSAYSISTDNSGEKYSHYWMKWVSGSNDADRKVKFDVANEYNNSLSNGNAGFANDDYTINSDAELKQNANVRFMYNNKTNKLSRAYLSGSSAESDLFLVLRGNASNKLYKVNTDGSKGSVHTTNSTDNWAFFKDNNNWIYQADVYALPNTRIKLTARMKDKNNANKTQYFKGEEESPDDTFASEKTDLLIGGIRPGSPADADYYKMRVIYDFKTNRLMTAWLPSELNSDLAINADVMLVREGQGGADQITLNDHTLSKVKTIYSVMQFNRWKLNNRANPTELAVEKCTRDAGSGNRVYDEATTNTYHPALASNDANYLSESARNIYWISFPFDVNLNEVFGSLGTYGVQWGIEYYDGKARAQQGYWADSPGFWKLYPNTNRKLKAYEGYLLVLDLDYFAYNNTVTWANNVQQLELYFPYSSTSALNIATATETAEFDQTGYQCTIDRRTNKSVADINEDRRIADSYWHCMGVPSFHDVNKDVTTENPESATPPEAGTYWTPTGNLYLYEWNPDDNSYTVKTTGGSSYQFKSLWAYMVQYSGTTLTWSSVSKVNQIVARRAIERADYSLKLDLMRGDKEEDHTLMRMTEDEGVTSAFEFNHDLFKEMNGGKGNIWTVTSDAVPVAGSSMPMSEQKTVVPVGVKIATEGEYTFAIPEGTEGVGVVMVDKVTGTRTNLGLTDYTVWLEAGTCDTRFEIEISPVEQVPTGIDNSQGTIDNSQCGVRKVLIDGVLYIIRDGKVYDATGRMKSEK